MSKKVQDDVIALAERLLDTSGAGSIDVTWFGGEPFLAPDIIESLSERLIRVAEKHQAAYHADIITNGYLLTQAMYLAGLRRIPSRRLPGWIT